MVFQFISVWKSEFTCKWTELQAWSRSIQFGGEGAAVCIILSQADTLQNVFKLNKTEL